MYKKLHSISNKELNKAVASLWDDERPGSCEPACAVFAELKVVDNGWEADGVWIEFGEVYNFGGEYGLRGDNCIVIHASVAKHLRAMAEVDAFRLVRRALTEKNPGLLYP